MVGFIRPSDSGVVFDRDEAEVPLLPTAGPRGAAELPVRAHERDLLHAVERHQVVVVAGETGCGKSTQLPQMLVDAQWGGVAVAEPNSLAAVTLARRVTAERKTRDVGHCIRFDSSVGPGTKIAFYTCDSLLRELTRDPLLTRYGVVVVDEAHTRTLLLDLLLGVLRKVLRKRPGLRLVISSATLDAAPLHEFFSGLKPCGVQVTPAAPYPVEVYYAKSAVEDYVKATATTVLDIHRRRPTGDVLAFLPHQDAVHAVVSLLTDRQCLGHGGARMVLHALHTGQAHDEQLEVALGAGSARDRRIIVATNVAETSVTIPGIVYVVDSGFVEERIHDPDSGVERMVVVPASRSEGKQRAGRCGRTAAGECYRLFTEHAHRELLQEHPLPQVLKAELSPLVLGMKALGVSDVTGFPLPAPPATQRVQRCLEKLYSLGALDDYGGLRAPVGPFVARFPGPPEVAAFLLSCYAMDVGEAGVKIAAMLSVRGVFLKGRAYAKRLQNTKEAYFVAEGDHLSLLNIFTAFSVEGSGDAGWARERGLNRAALQRAVQLAKHYEKCVRAFFKDGAGGDAAAAWPTEKIEEALEGNRLRTKEYSSTDRDADVLTLCVASAWFANLAARGGDNAYATVRPQRADAPLHIPSTSALYEKQPEWVLFTECTEVGGATYISNCVEVRNPLWLVTLAPHFYDYTRNPNHPKAVGSRKRRREEEADRAKRPREPLGVAEWLGADLFGPS